MGWIIFEGLDKSGKGTLELEVLKATKYKHVVIDRGPVGYKIFDEVFGRSTWRSRCKFVEMATNYAKKNDCLVVLCVVNPETALKRIEEHGETCPYDYEFWQLKLQNDVVKYYRDKFGESKYLIVDTTNASIESCTNNIVDWIERNM